MTASFKRAILLPSSGRLYFQYEVEGPQAVYGRPSTAGSAARPYVEIFGYTLIDALFVRSYYKRTIF